MMQHQRETMRQELLTQRTSIQNALEEILAHPQHAMLGPGINQALQRKICGVFFGRQAILNFLVPQKLQPFHY
jgi:hypothetical protein